MTRDPASAPDGAIDPLGSAARLRAVARTQLMDAGPDETFDRLVRVVARTLDVPVAVISLVDEVRQVFVGATGLSEPWSSRRGTDLSHSLCRYVVTTDRPFVVADARQDARLTAHPAVTELDVAAYAGVPFRAPGGEALGALCVVDDRPRTWTDEQIETLQVLSRAASSEVALRLAASRHRALVSQARHRLGTPLTALQVQLDQTVGSCPQHAGPCEQLDGARTQVRRLAAGLEDLTADAASVPFGHEETIELTDLLTTVAARWNRTATDDDRMLTVQPYPSTYLRVPAAALRDALDALIRTARDHGPGTICLGARQDPRTTRVRVAFGDTAIPAATLAALLRRRDHARPEDDRDPFSLAETVSLRLGARLTMASDIPNALDLVFARPSPGPEPTGRHDR